MKPARNCMGPNWRDHAPSRFALRGHCAQCQCSSVSAPRPQDQRGAGHARRGKSQTSRVLQVHSQKQLGTTSVTRTATRATPARQTPVNPPVARPIQAQPDTKLSDWLDFFGVGLAARTYRLALIQAAVLTARALRCLMHSVQHLSRKTFMISINVRNGA